MQLLYSGIKSGKRKTAKPVCMVLKKDPNHLFLYPCWDVLVFRIMRSRICLVLTIIQVCNMLPCRGILWHSRAMNHISL